MTGDLKKNIRHKRIFHLISNHVVVVPKDLHKLLLDDGFDVTLETVIDDIQALRLILVPDRMGNCRYSSRHTGDSEVVKTSYKQMLCKAITKVDSAKNIVVVKTHPGMAHTAAAAIEITSIQGVVGSIAGDDTIMLIGKTDDDALEIAELIQKNVGDTSFDFALIVCEAVLDIDLVKNIVVVKTHPGMAHAAAEAIEKANLKSLVGSVAGDDTIILVGKDDDSASEITKQLRAIARV